MSIDYMIDLETFSTEDTALILSIGIVSFDPNTYDQKMAVIEDSFYRNVTLDFSSGHVSEGTVIWWMQQPKETQDHIFNKQAVKDAVSLDNALGELVDFMEDSPRSEKVHRNSYVWGNSPRFDLKILEHHFKEDGLPWNFWQEKDVRTAKAMIPKHLMPERTGAHNALQDAVYQARQVQLFFELFYNRSKSLGAS